MKINHRHLKAVMSLASNDETRFLLNGVNIEPVKDGNLLVATDGRRLGVLFMPGTPITESFVLPKTFLKFIPTGAGIKEFGVELVHTREATREIHITSPGMPRMIIDPIEGVYPKWRQVVPTGPFSPANINVSALILEPFLDCAKILSPSSPHLHFRQGGDDIGAISVFINNPLFFGVIMPIREEGSTKQIPDWAKL